MSGYRSGGGRRGNLAAGMLSVLKSSIPGVAAVTNPVAATGGVDGETLDDARRRAPLELRTRYRAVTADDFEALCAEASRQVARVFCHPARSRRRAGAGAPPADGRGLRPQARPWRSSRRARSCWRRWRRTSTRAGWSAPRVHLAPVPLRGVSVVCDVQAALGADPGRVEHDIERMLYTYLNPLVGGNPHGAGHRVGVRALAQPGRALRRRPPGAGGRVREDPARVRDRPRHRQAGAEAARLAPRDRAARADRVGHPHRQGAPTGSCRGGRRRTPHPAAPDGRSCTGRPRVHADIEPPPAASARRYLRDHLPAVYSDPPRLESGAEGLAARFVGSLERVLDPVVASLDCLPAQLATDTAPAPMLALMAGVARARGGRAPLARRPPRRGALRLGDRAVARHAARARARPAHRVPEPAAAGRGRRRGHVLGRAGLGSALGAAASSWSTATPRSRSSGRRRWRGRSTG